MSKYSPQLLTDCVRQTFSTPEGQVVLEWLRDLYINYRSTSLVQSSSPNLQIQLGYRLGQQDVPIMIQQVIDGALVNSDKQESSSEDEYE